MKFAALLLSTALIGSGIVGWAYWTAISEPIVRFAEIEMLPPESSHKPLRILLLSDIHVAGPDMSPQRLSRIVRQANAQKPDAVLIAGDFVSDKQLATKRFSLDEAIAPLHDLESRFGTFAVLGNHDHWRNGAAAQSALRRVGIQVLDNSAARVGPLVIGGLDDAFTHHDDLSATLRAMADLGGQPILLSHSPDPFPRVPARVKLMLAGHTHCGQIRLPIVGAISYMSKYGDKYACGVVVEDGKTLVVGLQRTFDMIAHGFWFAAKLGHQTMHNAGESSGLTAIAATPIAKVSAYEKDHADPAAASPALQWPSSAQARPHLRYPSSPERVRANTRLSDRRASLALWKRRPRSPTLQAAARLVTAIRSKPSRVPMTVTRCPNSLVGERVTSSRHVPPPGIDSTN